MVTTKKILQPKPNEPHKLCNCFVKEDCPMNGLSLTSSILHQATIKCNDSKYQQKDTKECGKRPSRNVIQTTKKSFNLIKFKNDATLCIEYWTLKQKQYPKTYMGNQRTV